MNDTTLLALRAAVEAALRERRELREGGCYDSDDFCDGYERGLERAIRIISQADGRDPK